MKKAIRLYLTGLIQSLFFRQFVLQQALQYGINGYLLKHESGMIEIFIEGESASVDAMTEACKRGPKHAKIYDIKEQPERLQDFKEFKLMKF